MLLKLKPSNKSIYSLKIDAVSSWAMYLAHQAAFDLGLGDAICILTCKFDLEPLGLQVLYNQDGAPTRGWGLVFHTSNFVGIRLFTAGGAEQNLYGGVALTEGEYILIWQIDRDGNCDIYDCLTGTQYASIDISSYAAIDQSNTSQFRMFNPTATWATRNMSHFINFQYWNFGAGGLPSAAICEDIRNELVQNPYDIPPTLNNRVDKATELRLHLTLDNIDPTFRAIPDESAYANNLNLNGIDPAYVIEEIKQV